MKQEFKPVSTQILCLNTAPYGLSGMFTAHIYKGKKKQERGRKGGVEKHVGCDI